MIDFTLSPPAIIECQEVREISFGLSYATSRTELDKFIIPRDWKDATLEEIRAYIPYDLRDFPDWAIQAMFPLFARTSGKKLIKTTVFLTNMSGSNQTWAALADWNSAENIVHCIGGGGSGGGLTGDGATGGGGGGAYANRSNITLTPNANVTFRLGNRASVGTGNGGTGSDVWFNGSTLANSSVGAKGGAGNSGTTGGSGGSDTSSVGNVRYKGGNGGNALSSGGDQKASGGGGGAAGPNGNGGNGTAGTYSGGSGATNGSGGHGGNNAGGIGGTGGSGGSGGSNGGNGTEFQTSPAYGSGGGAGGRFNNTGALGGNYGGGGGGVTRGAFGSPTGGQGAQGLIVIINNHIKGV